MKKKNTSRRKQAKNNGSIRSVVGFVLFVVLVCLSYEPLAEYLQKRGIALPVAVQQADTSSSTTALTLPDSSHVESPAPLTDRPERILKRRGYTVSFNRDWNLPNWVAWELTPEKLVERESRTDKFLPDPDLPEAEAVVTDDYKNSGYDRGHICPAADNRWHWKAMFESFYLTNICPQNHNLNRGDWKELEEACRNWAQKEGKIYIVGGPICYDRRQGRTIGQTHRIRVPDAFFKVILCLEGGKPKAIGFVYPNESGNRPMKRYVRTVDYVERITGIDFFPALPDAVEEEVEAMADLERFEATPAR